MLNGIGSNISAISALARSSANISASAGRIAAFGGSDAGNEVDLASEFAGQMVDKTAFSANLTVISSADSILGSLLDIMA